MKRAWGLGVAVCAVLLAGCLGQDIRDDRAAMNKADYAHAPAIVDDGRSPFPNVPLVSLHELACSPEKYAGQEVRVQGIALIEQRNNNLYFDLFPKQIGPCGRAMIGMDYPADFLKMAASYNRKRMEFVGTFQRSLCGIEKYKYARVNDPNDPTQTVCKSVELRSDAFLTNVRGWRLMPE
jgi:hypothetical protein